MSEPSVSSSGDHGEAAGGEVELRKLRWRCRRGMRELDVLLERYLRQRFREAPPAEQTAFRGLLELQDPELWRFCMGEERPSSQALAQCVDRLIGAIT